MRTVILLFGPAGAGKTTTARQAPDGYTIYDRDDPPWRHHTEAHFRQAIAAIAHNPQAKAVIIRAGATSTARAAATRLTAATHGYLIKPDKATCHQRAGHRRRHDVHTNHASIETWFARFDHNDGCPLWPGWAVVLGTQTSALSTVTAAERHSWAW